MRIAMLVSNFIRLPPEADNMPSGFSGAPEYMAWILTEELVKKGHEVTLFAAGDSKTSAWLESIAPVSSYNQPKRDNPEFIIDQEHVLVSRLYKEAEKGRFDIIHSHLGSRSAFYASFFKVPTVVTIHSPLDGEAGSVLKYFQEDQYYVSISNSQRKPLPDLNYAATIYHGLEIEKIRFNDRKENFLLFVGRIAPQKGVLEAIMAAKTIGRKLVIIGTIPENSGYFENEIKPLINSQQIEIYGFLDREELYKWMSRASCLLFPIKWEEPFGLVMVESMASGTPVVAFNRGSTAEVIRDGETGYLVDQERGVDGLVEALEKVDKIDYSKCRRWVEGNFTLQKMTERYEEVYRKILKLA